MSSEPYLYPQHSFFDDQDLSIFSQLNALFYQFPALPTVPEGSPYASVLPAADDHPLMIYFKYMILSRILVRSLRGAAIVCLFFCLAGLQLGMAISSRLYDLAVSAWYGLGGPYVWRRYYMVPDVNDIIFNEKRRN